MTNNKIILAAGNKINSLENYSIETSDLAGVKITSNSIGLATGSGNSRNLIYMKDGAIEIGNATAIANANAETPNYSGNFIKLSEEDGVIIGSSSSFYLNATNMVIDSTVTGTGQHIGTGMRLGSEDNPGLLFDG